MISVDLQLFVTNADIFLHESTKVRHFLDKLSVNARSFPLASMF